MTVVCSTRRSAPPTSARLPRACRPRPLRPLTRGESLPTPRGFCRLNVSRNSIRLRKAELIDSGQRGPMSPLASRSTPAGAMGLRGPPSARKLLESRPKALLLSLRTEECEWAVSYRARCATRRVWYGKRSRASTCGFRIACRPIPIGLPVHYPRAISGPSRLSAGRARQTRSARTALSRCGMRSSRGPATSKSS